MRIDKRKQCQENKDKIICQELQSRYYKNALVSNHEYPRNQWKNKFSKETEDKKKS